MSDGEGGLEALKAFRAISPGLSDIWDEDMDAEHWPTVRVKDGRVTHLKLEGTPKAPVALGDEGLPAELGGMIHLVTLELIGVRQLAALPPQVGMLSKLTTLAIRGSNDLLELPQAIGQLSKLETLDLHSCTKLSAIPIEVGNLHSLRAIKVQNCVNLETLPAEIGNLTALKTLRADGCSKLRELPVEFGMLTNLSALNIEKCKALDLPEELKSLTAKPEEITGYLAAHLAISGRSVSTPIVTWLHKRPSAVAVFLAQIVTDPARATELGRAFATYPSLIDVTDKTGKKAIEHACEECKAEMEASLFFLSRYEIDAGPPMHCSATCTVFGAFDCDDKTKKERRCLKLLRDEQTLLAELKGRLGIDNGVLVPILTCYASASEVQTEQSLENVYNGKVPIERVTGLELKLGDLMSTRAAIGSSILAAPVFRYVLVMKPADANLAALAPMMTRDLPCVRKCVTDVAKGVSASPPALSTLLRWHAYPHKVPLTTSCNVPTIPLYVL